jgi:uncharacterized protein (TIGR02611 family)
MGQGQRSRCGRAEPGGHRCLKKFFIALIGGTVVLIGVAMLVLPGPGALVIAGGLAILATEFIWARRAMRNVRSAVAKVRRKSGLKEWLRRLKPRAGVKPEQP